MTASTCSGCWLTCVTLLPQRTSIKGLVAKKDNPSDARGVALSLTPKGRKLWKPTMQLIEARNQQILGCLSPEEQATLSQWLDRLVAHNVKK